MTRRNLLGRARIESGQAGREVPARKSDASKLVISPDRGHGGAKRGVEVAGPDQVWFGGIGLAALGEQEASILEQPRFPDRVVLAAQRLEGAVRT